MPSTAVDEGVEHDLVRTDVQAGTVQRRQHLAHVLGVPQGEHHLGEELEHIIKKGEDM